MSSNNRTFGVEFELFFTKKGWSNFLLANKDFFGKELTVGNVGGRKDELLKAINQNNSRDYLRTIDYYGPHELVEIFLYKKLGFSKSWKVVEDGSIYGGESAGPEMEIITPPLSEASGGLQMISKFCQAFKPYASVNKTTGLHVHVDAKEFIQKKEQKNLSHRLLIALMSYKSVEPLFDELVTASRRANKNREFAQATPSEVQLYASYKQLIIEDGSSLDAYIYAFQEDRYNKLNLWSLEKHGTLEFRQMHGTLNEKLITGWIKIALNFIEQVLKTDSDLKSYFIKQQKLIKNQYAQVNNDLNAEFPNTKNLDMDLMIQDMLEGNKYYINTVFGPDPAMIAKGKKIIQALRSDSIDSKAAIDYLKKAIALNQKKLVPTRIYNQAKQAYKTSPLAEDF